MRDLISLGHLNLMEISEEGDAKIRASHIGIIGLGGTGGLAAQLFVRAGVKSLTIVDFDHVNETNLQRQINYTTGDVRQSKAKITENVLSRIRGDVTVISLGSELTAGNAKEILSGLDLIFDGTDNIRAREIINEYSVQHGIPWIFTSAIGTTGQFKTVIPGVTSCLRCFVTPDMLNGGSCSDLGILNSVPSIVSALAYTEGIRVLTGGNIDGALHFIDAWDLRHEKITIRRREDCEVCVQRKFTHIMK